MTIQYTLSVKNVTTNSATVVITLTAAVETATTEMLAATCQHGPSKVETVTIPVGNVGDTIDVPFTGLRSGREYRAFGWTTGSVTFTTLADDTTKTATIDQWQEMADRINEKVGEDRDFLSLPETVEFVTADNIEFSTMPGNYSTVEMDTRYTWVDGSRIYKKTVNFGTLPNSSAKTVAHGITNLNWIIGLEGVAKSSSGDRLLMPFPWEGSVGGTIACYADSNNIFITTWMDRSDYSGYVTLYYTKSS